MYGCGLRWLALVPLALLFAFMAMMVEIAAIWPGMAARPDWLWALAFAATIHVAAVPSLIAMFLCGLVRDLVLGPTVGSATIAFVLVGWIIQFAKPNIRLHGIVGQAVMAGASGFLIAIIKHALDWYGYNSTLWITGLVQSAGDGLLTGAASIPVALVLSVPGICPWSERESIFS